MAWLIFPNLMWTSLLHDVRALKFFFNLLIVPEIVNEKMQPKNQGGETKKNIEMNLLKSTENSRVKFRSKKHNNYRFLFGRSMIYSDCRISSKILFDDLLNAKRIRRRNGILLMLVCDHRERREANYFTI